MSKTFTYNAMFLELIDNLINTKHRFDNHELSKERLIAEIRLSYMDTIHDFTTDNNIRIMGLEEAIELREKEQTQ